MDDLVEKVARAIYENAARDDCRDQARTAIAVAEPEIRRRVVEECAKEAERWWEKPYGIPKGPVGAAIRALAEKKDTAKKEPR